MQFFQKLINFLKPNKNQRNAFQIGPFSVMARLTSWLTKTNFI